MPKEYLELQSVLTNGSVITDVEVRDNRTYFRIDGRLFATFDNKVMHEDAPLFSHSFTDYLAKQANTPEGIEETEKTSEKINKEIDLWFKHKLSLYKILFLRGLEMLTKKGDKEFEKYLEYHLDISPNGSHCNQLLHLLENTNL